MTGHIWHVRYGNVHVITNTVQPDREDAKRKAQAWIGGDPDRYVVEPLATNEDRVHVSLTLQV